MGYDMSFVRSGGDDYFRLNIWGMGRYAHLMLDLGMAYPSASPGGWPEWNRYPDDDKRQRQFETAHEHLKHGEALDVEVPDDVMASAREYTEQGNAILRAHPDGGAVIPTHKFGSNDGWVVTPDEITAALAAYDAHPDRDDQVAAHLGEDRKAYWDQWIDYLRRAVDADGFEVW